MNRHWLTPLLLASTAAILFPAPASAQETLAGQFFISHSLGNLPSVDPLVDPNTFFVVGEGQSKDLPLDVRAVNFSGTVRLNTSCCVAGGDGFVSNRIKVEVVPNKMELHGGGYSEKSFEEFRADFSAPRQAWEEVAQFARPALRVTTPASLQAGDTGNFLVRVDGTDTTFGGGVSAQSYVVFSVVPIRTDNTLPSCVNMVPFTSPLPEVLPLGPITTRTFGLKAADPARVQYSIATTTIQNQNVGWQFDIAKAGVPLDPSEALIVFVNPTKGTKSLWTYDSKTCKVSANLVLNPGDTGTLRISSADTTTIVLSDPYDDHAVFAEPNFWTLFGGRQVTISVVN